MVTDLSPAVRLDEASDTAKRAALVDNRGKRIGILIVTYNAVTTLAKVLKRIPPRRLEKRRRGGRSSTMPARTPLTNWRRH